MSDMTAPATPMTGRHVLLWLLGAFAAICIANAALVWFALETFTGETQPKSYATGLDFNRTLEQVAAQHARGLSVQGSVTSPAARTVTIESRYRDSAGAPLNGLSVTASFSRPTHEGYDFTEQMTDQGGGVFSARVTTPLAGVWNVRLTAAETGRPPYILDYRVVVK
ncbi:MAG: FixH family protein [Rhodospirillaceae bacterium]|nr:FixH family protein [Rhodospirillaceae bacterium]